MADLAAMEGEGGGGGGVKMKKKNKQGKGQKKAGRYTSIQWNFRIKLGQGVLSYIYIERCFLFRVTWKL